MGVCICDEIKSLNESGSMHTAIRLPFLAYINNFFQITISEFLGKFNDKFHYTQIKLSLAV